jgi:hypothetical protein
MKFYLFLLLKLPAAWICGVRLSSLNQESCITSIKHRWLNQNPFGSIYFACLSMAAELSTGLPAFLYIRKSNKPVSMLLTGMESKFIKKAKGRIQFTCITVNGINEQLGKLIKSGDQCTMNIESKGYNDAGEEVASFTFIWSFKYR